MTYNPCGWKKKPLLHCYLYGLSGTGAGGKVGRYKKSYQKHVSKYSIITVTQCMLYQEAVMIKILSQYLLLRFTKMKMWMTEYILCTLLNAGWDIFHHYYNGTKVADLVSNTLDLYLEMTG